MKCKTSDVNARKAAEFVREVVMTLSRLSDSRASWDIAGDMADLAFDIADLEATDSLYICAKVKEIVTFGMEKYAVEEYNTTVQKCALIRITCEGYLRYNAEVLELSL